MYRGQADCGELRIDLTFLAPLWRLYAKLSEDHGPEKTKSLIRALTELFLIAEHVAMVSKAYENSVKGFKIVTTW